MADNNENNGRFVWYENLTNNSDAAIKFYTKVMSWKTQPFAEDNDYVMWVSEQGPIGGVMKLPAEAVKMGARHELDGARPGGERRFDCIAGEETRR